MTNPTLPKNLPEIYDEMEKRGDEAIRARRESGHRTPEARAVSICVIAKGVGKGLLRNHTERCGECKKIAEQIQLAILAERERCAKLLEDAELENTAYMASVIRKDPSQS